MGKPVAKLPVVLVTWESPRAAKAAVPVASTPTLMLTGTMRRLDPNGFQRAYVGVVPL
jgi:hypothetical protein